MDKAGLALAERSHMLEIHSKLGFPGDGRAGDTWSATLMS